MLCFFFVHDCAEKEDQPEKGKKWMNRDLNSIHRIISEEGESHWIRRVVKHDNSK